MICGRTILIEQNYISDMLGLPPLAAGLLSLECKRTVHDLADVYIYMQYAFSMPPFGHTFVC